MFKLVIKEIMLQKKIIALCIIYAIVGALIFGYMDTNNSEFYGSLFLPIAIAYTLIMSSCAKEDKSKSHIIFNSLPISRGDIVLSKYISAFVFLIISIIICVVSYAAISFAGVKVRGGLNVSYISILFILTALLSSIYFPVFLKVGYLKSKYFQMVLILFLMFIPMIFNDYLMKHNAPQFISDFVNQSKLIINIEVIIFTLIISVISIFVSKVIYNNNDF